MLHVPAHLQAAADALQARLPDPRALAPRGIHRMTVEGQSLHFPGRVYAPATQLFDVAASLPDSDAAWLCLCLATRHHDGHVRQRAVMALPPDLPPWVLAFKVVLLGEYVVSIAQVLERQLSAADRQACAALATQNPALFNTLQQRAASYWNCYYRADSALADFPNHRLLRAIRHAAHAARADGTVR